jgi:hypothetical protein
MTELGRASVFALSAVALVLGVTAGCTDASNLPQGTLGGAGGGGKASGGNSTSGSSSSGSATGGTANGGSAGATAGSAGTSTGGSGGSGGSGGTGGTGTAGNGGSGGMMTGCTILPVTQPMIYEFPASVDPGAGGAGGEAGAGGASPVLPAMEGFSFGYNGNPPSVFSGYSFFYPEETLESNVAEGNWHVSGTVGTYAGFQVGFVCGANASDYLGISFTISGNAGPSGSLSFVVPHATNVWKEPLNTTTAAKCMAPGQYDGTCQEAAATVEVSETETTVSLLWADLVAGKPEMNPNPAELMGLRWLFAWDAVKELDPEANEYEVDVRLDNLTFIEE